MDGSVRRGLRTVYTRALQAVGSRLDFGTNILERDWDVLVVLDACRADLLAATAPTVDWLGEVATVRSVGSSSSEWLTNTFEGHPETERTVMVTGNTWTDRYVTAGAFAALDEVWKYAWDEEIGTVPPAAITDRAVALARDRDPDRLVAHYMQPHHPFIPDPLDADEGMVRSSSAASTTNPWTLLREGAVTRQRVWDAYEANLQHVLSEVAALRANVTGRMVITADHGNLFGEWGLYGHPMHLPVPALLAVPWAETTASDRGDRTPGLAPPEPLPVSRVREGNVTDRLEALGYR
jgi:hypothetical protein